MMSQGCREQEKAVIGRDTDRIKSVDFKLWNHDIPSFVNPRFLQILSFEGANPVERHGLVILTYNKTHFRAIVQ